MPSTVTSPVGVRVAVADDDRADDVRARVLAVAVAVRPALGWIGSHLGRALRVDDRLERLVVDADPLGGAARLLGMLGGDDRDRLAEVADALEGEHRLVAELEPVALLARDVLVREHGVDAGHAGRRGRVDRADERVRVRAADGVAPEHPGGEEVARVGELAGDLGDRVDAADGLADAAELELAGGRAHRRRLARSWHGCAPSARRCSLRSKAGGGMGWPSRPSPAAARTASKIFW